MIYLPKRLMLSPTTYCNSHCNHCNNWKNNFMKPSFTYEQGQQFISDFYDLTKLANDKLSYEVNFAGYGEPTCYTQLWGLIKFANNLDLKTSITTNAILLDDAMIPDIIDSGIDDILISINSHIAKVHDNSRGTKGNYNHTINFVDKLHKYKLKHHLDKPQLHISSILGDFNYDHFIDFIDYMSNLKQFQSFTFNIYTQLEINPVWLQHPKEIIGIVTKCRDKYYNSIFLNVPNYILNNLIGYVHDGRDYKPNFYCKSTINNLWVDSYLNVSSCLNLNEFSYGNLNLQSLKEIVLNPFNQSIIEKRMKGNCRKWCGIINCTYQ